MSQLNINTVSSLLISLKTDKKIPINSICREIKNDKYRLKKNVIPTQGGVYVFWWTGSRRYFKNKINRVVPISGPSKRNVTIEITDKWLDSLDPICLYVGKNSESIRSRIGQHLRLQRKRDSNIGDQVLNSKPPTTSCQLKNGMEKLFKNELDIRNLILNNISLSYVILDNDIEAINRFYLEDKAIGEFYPILNMDIER